MRDDADDNDDEASITNGDGDVDVVMEIASDAITPSKIVSRARLSSLTRPSSVSTASPMTLTFRDVQKKSLHHRTFAR